MCVFLIGLLTVATSLGVQATPEDGNWASQDTILRNTPEAELMVRAGDIDNLGFGWPEGFDPFSGNNTPSHAYPWTPDTTDPAGTDRIMVVSSYDGSPPAGQDGYTNSTSRPDNAVSPLTLHYDVAGITVQSAVLQVFVDDFQAPVWGANYQVRLNGTRVPLLETIINDLRQTGPIGKIITTRIPNQYLHLLRNDSLQILADDYTTGAGDGFAFDFAKLLVNPVSLSQRATIKGTIKEEGTGTAVDSVRITANGSAWTYSDGDGNFTIDSVLAGLVSVQTYKAGYGSESMTISVSTGDTATADFTLKTPAPVVVEHTPADSVYGFDGDTLRVSFSTAMDTGSIDPFTFYLSDSTGNIEGEYLKGDSTVAFVPGDLAGNTEYIATLTTGITDQNETSLEKDYSWRFFTYSKSATGSPRSVESSHSPSVRLDGITAIASGSAITVRYQLGNAGTVSAGVVDLHGRTTGSTLNVHQNAGSHELVISSKGLASGTYFMRLSVGREFAVVPFVR